MVCGSGKSPYTGVELGRESSTPTTNAYDYFTLITNSEVKLLSKPDKLRNICTLLKAVGKEYQVHIHTNVVTQNYCTTRNSTSWNHLD